MISLEQLPLYQTRTIATAAQDDQTRIYLFNCLQRFYNRDYGEVPKEDTAANNAELEAGEGHVLARYKAQGALTEDIYIEAHFSESLQGVDTNNILIMYPWER